LLSAAGHPFAFIEDTQTIGYVFSQTTNDFHQGFHQNFHLLESFLSNLALSGAEQ